MNDIDDLLASDSTISNSGDSSIRLIALPMVLFFISAALFYPFIVTLNDLTIKQQQDLIVTGIDSALDSFVINYDDSNENLKNLSEGYLNSDDPTEYNYHSNALNLNNHKAFSSFRKVFCDSTTFSEQELMQQFKLIRIYTVYNQSLDKPSYFIEFYKLDGSFDGSLCRVNSLAEVQSMIEEKYKCTLDFYRNVTPEASLRKAQEYSRKENYRPNQTTVSSYNTFICLATNVKVQKRFFIGEKYVNFAEVQTYSSARMGVNDERTNVN